MNRWHDTSYDTAVTTKLYDTSLPLRTAAFAAHHNAGQKMTDETGVQSPEVCADWELREDACEYQDAVDTLRPGPRLEAYKNGGISADSAYSGQSTASHPPPSEPDAPPDLDPCNSTRPSSSQRSPPNRRTM